MRPVFVFFILCTFRFSSINKEYNRRLGYHLSLGTRFRQKPQHLASIRFLQWKIWRFQPFLPLTYDWWSKWLWWKTSQTGLLEYEYRDIFVLVLGVICTLLTGFEYYCIIVSVFFICVYKYVYFSIFYFYFFYFDHYGREKVLWPSL